MSALTDEPKSPPSKTTPTSSTRPNRLPAPTLFVGPPSRNASQLSFSQQLSAGAIKAAREPVQRQKSNYDSTLKPKDIPILQLRRPSEKSIETKWREMQSTLNEVELTAQTSQHVFGERHATALDELRRAQIDLAKAWGRGNEEQSTPGKGDSIADERQDVPPIGRRRGDTEASNSTQLSGESETSDSTMRSIKSHLEEDTAEDIRLANERRAANEAYFKKVDKSVKEVVSKLEAVAEAMRGVEAESRSLWEGDSVQSNDTVARG